MTDKRLKTKDKARTSRDPFFEDEEDETCANAAGQQAGKSRAPSKRPSSQHLRELSQEQQNSPRKALQLSQQSLQPNSNRSNGKFESENIDTSSAAAHLVDAMATAAAHKPHTAAAADNLQKEHLNNAIASLLARKEAAGARRNTSEQSARNDSLGKRRRGPLGRAPSGGSFGSNLSMRASSIGSNISQDEQRPTEPLPNPSQKIIYEDERAQEERRALIRKMGGRVDVAEEQRKRAESIGTVKDAIPATGAAGLVGRRAKRKAGKKS
jgi:hypothetical protein